MKPYWWAWTLVILALSTIMNIINSLPNKKIKDNKLLTTVWARIYIILAGLIALISFFVPKIGMTDKLFNEIKEEINIPLTVFASIVLNLLFTILPIAISNAGPVSVAIMNLNFVIQLIFGVLFLNSTLNNYQIFGSLFYIGSVLVLAYANTLKK